MEGKIVSLVPAPKVEKAAPDASIIKLVEDLLGCAKRGELKGLVFVAAYQDGAYDYTRNGLDFDVAVALHMRAIYKIQREIDALAQSTITH